MLRLGQARRSISRDWLFALNIVCAPSRISAPEPPSATRPHLGHSNGTGDFPKTDISCDVTERQPTISTYVFESRPARHFGTKPGTPNRLHEARNAPMKLSGSLLKCAEGEAPSSENVVAIRWQQAGRQPPDQRLSSDTNLAKSPSRSAVSHSQTIITRHPNSLRAIALASSRSALCRNFSFQ